MTRRTRARKSAVPTQEVDATVAVDPAPGPAPDTAPVELSSRRASRKIARPAPATDDADAALAAAARVAASTPDEPAAPSERWLAPIDKLRVAAEPLSLVRHRVSKALVGSFANADCGYTLMVDPKAPLSAAEVDLERCGWCVKLAAGEQIPPYNKGQRRPVLPDDNLVRVRQRTPEPRKVEVAPEIAALLDESAFNAALGEVQTAMQRILGGEWAPNAEEMARLNTLSANLKLAAETRGKATVTKEPDGTLTLTSTAVAPTRTRSEAAAQVRGPRGPLVRVAKQTVDGEAATLPDVRKDGKLLGVLFRTFDPQGPFLLGDGNKRWTVRDIRTNEDRYFGKDKKGAIDYLNERLAELSMEERASGAALARARMQASDPTHRRSR